MKCRANGTTVPHQCSCDIGYFELVLAAPWTVERIEGGFKVLDANGQ